MHQKATIPSPESSSSDLHALHEVDYVYSITAPNLWIHLVRSVHIYPPNPDIFNAACE